MESEDRASVGVLEECIALQRKKGEDYNGVQSTVTQAMYYPRGLDTINDIILAKFLRIQSVLDLIRAGKEPNFESLEDSYKDMINYASFAAAWIRGKVPGQTDVDLFNRPKAKWASSTIVEHHANCVGSHANNTSEYTGR